MGVWLAASAKAAPYHGRLARRQAEGLLEPCRLGTFLLRQSLHDERLVVSYLASLRQFIAAQAAFPPAAMADGRYRLGQIGEHGYIKVCEVKVFHSFLDIALDGNAVGWEYTGEFANFADFVAHNRELLRYPLMPKEKNDEQA
jgi:hypothetical protein